MTASRMIIGDYSNTAWISTPTCIRKFSSNTGTWEGTDWLLTAARIFFHCSSTPTVLAEGFQDAGRVDQHQRHGDPVDEHHGGGLCRG